MPITALDILPARTEVSSLSGLDTGYKAQGTSTGKNDGPSFSEMLERAGQKDTTDGKVNGGDTAADKTSATDAKPVEKVQDASETEKETPVLENQKNQVEKSLPAEEAAVAEELSDSKPAVEFSADGMKNVLSFGQNGSASEENAETKLLKAVSTAEKLASKQNASTSARVSPQELLETDELEEDSSANLAPVLTAKDVAKNAEPDVLDALNAAAQNQTAKTQPKDAISAGLVAESTAKETLPEETGDVKKEKKTRFSEYDSIVAMLSKQREQEAPAATQQAVSVSSDDLTALAAKTGAAIPVDEKIQVVDMRTESKQFEKHVSFDNKGNAEISLSLVPSNSAASSKNGVEFGVGAEGVSKADFASMLSKELSTSAGDIVKTGSIVLQNNGKGSINLILHPEQLGNVKIKLELSENQISGKIVVASREAYEAFKENISVIKEAFAASGFETGGFELAWGGKGNDGNPNRQDDRQLAQERSVNVNGVKYVETMPDVLPEEYAGSGMVNLVA